uniref:Uncharacterized protein n=1 Tax=Hucho hucho TaxID=62062 RepID=A0A4W5KY36_9TELE
IVLKNRGGQSLVHSSNKDDIFFQILKTAPVRYDPKTLCVRAYSVEKLSSLSSEDWRVFLLQLCSSLEAQADKTTAAARSKLNLLCYLCTIAAHKDTATRLINSQLVREGSLPDGLTTCPACLPFLPGLLLLTI